MTANFVSVNEGTQLSKTTSTTNGSRVKTREANSNKSTDTTSTTFTIMYYTNLNRHLAFYMYSLLDRTKD